MKKHSLLNRGISLVLSLVLVLSCLPAGLFAVANAANDVSGILSEETVADPITLNSWRETAFNPSDLTTEHAGGVWTDKTVLKKADIATKLPGVSGLDIGDNNFLVALSALGANSVIAGQGATATDTVFVLDLSNSMENNDLLAMVNATNDAIHNLLQANEDNRVGVVVYATNVNTLLPLDRYTPVQKGANTSTTNDDEIAYIEMANSYSQIRAARVTTGGSIFGGGTTTYVKDGDGDDVRTSISASGATYIQGGLWQAYQLFDRATNTDDRTPVLVLMSDGAPTYGDNNFNNVTSRDVGDGSTSSVTDGLAFLTQLTAAYVKEKIAETYETTAYFYSVGLGVSENGQQVSIAEAVLDSSKTRTTPENNWRTYLGLANAQNKTMRFSAAGENVTVTYDAAVTADSKNYTDRYFPAADASELSSAFQGIVNEISLKSSYNVTRLEGNDVHTSGYVTFVDEIGTGMEVKNIKGILIGNHLFSGEALAQATEDGDFGTEENPTTLGLNQIWALEERLRIEDTATQTAAERAWELLRQAKAAGQIYHSADGYSNYIGWFGDAEGKFVGFWNAAETNPVIPAGAVYANLCYGMLGSTTDSQTAHASDLMYVAITVSKKIVDGQILANTPQTVTFRVPASLLPTITYQIEVQAASDEEITESTPSSITYNPAQPIRLLYEVGVHSQLTPLNVQQFLREGYQAKDADGNYYLYTNAWYWEPSDGSDADFGNPPTKENATGQDVLYDTSKNHITYAYFEPSEQNEHYYFTEDTAIYTLRGNSYQKLTTAPVTDGSVTYYFQHKVFESKQAASATATKVDAQVDIHYGAISPKLLEDTENISQADGVYYIKAGTMHYETIHDHDREKEDNDTGSYLYRLHQLVDIATERGEESHHYEIAYLGNNGRITYAPAQGLQIIKVMDDGATPNATFTFDVALTAPAGEVLANAYQTVHISTIGTETIGSEAVSGGKMTVELKPGESIYILGLPEGTTYTVTEQDTYGYRLLQADGATGTIANNVVSEAVFTNTVRGNGSLTVAKWVTYKDGLTPTADSNLFDVTVTLQDEGQPFAGQITLDGENYTVTDGKVSFKIKHGQNVVLGSIPVDVTYSVVEDKATLPAGYAWTNEGAASLSGAIDADGNAAELTNEYDPDEVIINAAQPYLSVFFDKNYTHQADDTDAQTFQFQLQKYDGTKWVEVAQEELTFNPTSRGEYKQEDISLLTPQQPVTLSLDVAGNHYFRIAEVIPSSLVPGMAYDRTHKDFVVTVTDTDLDGKLEISRVSAVDEDLVSVTEDQDGNFTVDTTFNNRLQTQAAKLDLGAKKTLAGATLRDGQFSFALYETDDTFSIEGKTPVIARNGANGDIVFPTMTYPYEDDGPDYYYVMKEISTSGNGVTVDPTVWEILVEVDGLPSGEAYIYQIRWREQGKTRWSGHVLSPGDDPIALIVFENTYEAADATYRITGNKTLTNLTAGAAQTDMAVPGNTYSFTLTGQSGAPLPAQTTVYAAQGGNFAFEAITFDEPGTYTYTLSENNTGVPGVTYDSSVYTVEITVTDNGLGQLVANAVSYKGGAHASAIVFNNTYTAAPTGNVVLGGGKALTVEAGSQRDLHPGEFFFTLTAPDGAKQTVSNTLENGARFAFAPITFDTIGTYKYTIQEIVPRGAVNGTLDGITYVRTTLTVPIEVYDDGSGTLKVKTATGSLNSEGGFNYVCHFENFYEAEPATITLTAHKDLEGRDLNASDFTFNISAITQNAPMPQNTAAANDENGNVTFGQIEFAAVGTYKYLITENVPNAAVNNVFNGVTYSQKQYTVTVTVRDTGSGNLVAHVSSVDEDGAAQPGGVVFTNTYAAAPVKAHIQGVKKLFNQTGGANNEVPVPANTFHFKLEALNGAPAPQSAQVSAAEGGAISFGEIEFAEEGTYTYKMTEVDFGWGGMAFDSSEYTVQIKVRDNLRGNMEIESLKYIKGGIGYTEALFTNKYAAAPATAQIVANKVLTNQTPGVTQTNMDVPADTYKFKLESTNAPLPQQTEVYAAAGGAVTFPTITYTQAGTYTYTLTELDTQVPGVTYDSSVYTVTVTVLDDGAGQLVVDSVTYAKPNSSATAAVFENTYTAAPVKIHVEGDAAATGGKIFTDESSLPENKKDLDDFTFRFTLAKVGGDEVETVEDNGKGFAFEAIEFTEIGQYQYLIYERLDNDPGVTYDSSVYTVTVTVTDGGNGQLEASVKYERAESGESSDYETVSGIVFENSYKAKQTSVTFEGTKTLTGRDLQDKEFFFILKDAQSGQPIEIVQNDAEGNFSFLPFTYNAEGTYTYTLEEKDDGKKGITYDAAKYTLTVTVVDENGELKATTVITKDGDAANEISFANVYTPEKPSVPENDNPKTGDNFQMGVWTLMLTVSAIGLLAVLLLGRKKEENAQ